jgi:glycerol-3-phosphate dehydrogenase (NAD(P)+)
VNLAIVGAGGWGTALAIALAPRSASIRLWVFEHQLAERMAAGRENHLYLPGCRLPDALRVSDRLAETVRGADVVIGAMPSRHARRLYSEMLAELDPGVILVSATKGIETASLLRMSEVIDEVIRPRFPPRIAVLSGPTFAREVARGEPAAVVVASHQAEVAERIQKSFSGPTLRLYTNSDPVGVEIGAALKNVIAIAAGVCQGLNLGSNMLAALITRGLAEITRLAVALGGQPRTLAGLAGLGDLVLTCTGELSRNRMVGIELAKGRGIAEILGSMHMVAEGVETCEAAVALGAKTGVDLPIIEQMHAILDGRRSAREALRELLERSLKCE